MFQDPALLFVKALRWLFSQGLDRERSRNSIITFNFKQEAAFFPTPMFRGGSINLLTPGKRQSRYLAPRRRTGKINNIIYCAFGTFCDPVVTNPNNSQKWNVSFYWP